MALATISIKRHNHRIHPCLSSRKQELLKHLIELHQGKSILVISSANTTTTEFKDQNLTLSFDADLEQLKNRQWDLLISYEVPLDPQGYLLRLQRAKSLAVILVDETEQQALYPLETLLGRTIVPELVPGFEPPVTIKEREVTAPREPRVENSKLRDKRHTKKAWDKDSKPGEKKPWDKKKSFGDKKPRNDDKSAWNKDKKPVSKRPWEKDGVKSEKKSWDKDRKPAPKRPWDHKPWDKPETEASQPSATPKRKPRTFTVKSLKPSKED